MRVLVIVFVAGCVSRTPMREPDDPAVGNLDGTQWLDALAVPAVLGESCPPATTAKGWWRDAVTTAWCEDADGRRHGPMVVTTAGLTRVGHYREGVADGMFDGPEGRASYRMGRLEGPCTSRDGSLTFHEGRPEGQFRWSFGDWCEADTGGDDRPQDLGDCFANFDGRGSVTGVLAFGAATGTILVRRGQHAHEISVEPGVAADVPPELTAVAGDIAWLFGPKHLWTGLPRCGYGNDESVHRGHTPSGA